MKKTLLLMAICIIPLYSFGASKQPVPLKVRGEIFEPELSPKTPLFFFESERFSKGETLTSVVRYRDTKGNILVDEETQYEKGKLKSYRFHQLQTDELGTLEVKDGKVHFTFTAAGKKSVDEEEVAENMMVPDMVHQILSESWDKLEKGESVKVRFLLVELLESVGFKFFKDKDITYEGIPAIEVVMKASSFFIAALAPKIRIIMEKAPPHRILETNGRLPLRVPKVNPPKYRKDWRAIDGRLHFLYGPAAH